MKFVHWYLFLLALVAFQMVTCQNSTTNLKSETTKHNETKTDAPTHPTEAPTHPTETPTHPTETPKPTKPPVDTTTVTSTTSQSTTTCPEKIKYVHVRKFDFLSFIGGGILVAGLICIGYSVWRYNQIQRLKQMYWKQYRVLVPVVISRFNYCRPALHRI